MRLISLLQCLLLTGCGGGDEPPTVTYDRPGPPPGASVVAIKVPGTMAPGGQPARIEIPQEMLTAQWLRLEGDVDGGDTADPSTLILADITMEVQGTNAIAGSAGAKGEVSNGKVNYRLEIRCPPIAGTFLLELSQSNGKPESKRVFARGELKVK